MESCVNFSHWIGNAKNVSKVKKILCKILNVLSIFGLHEVDLRLYLVSHLTPNFNLLLKLG